MKKIIITLFLGMAVCSAYKPTTGRNLVPRRTGSTDYRDAYTGTYFCVVTCKRISPGGQEAISASDTVSLYITKDGRDSVLQIRFGETMLKTKLLSNTLQAYPRAGHYGGRFFASDSLDFTYAQGRSTLCKYRGKRI